MSLIPIATSAQVALQTRLLAKLRLPHPFLTTYHVVPLEQPPQQPFENDEGFLQVRLAPEADDRHPWGESLHRDDLSFINPRVFSPETHPPQSDNTLKARSERAPETIFHWKSEETPTTAQIWLLVHAILNIQPSLEIFRVKLSGSGNHTLRDALIASTLAFTYFDIADQQLDSNLAEVVISRGSFWQGAASPFGSRSPWTPSTRDSLNVEASDYQITTNFPNSRVHQRHPRRGPKPPPGSIVYSRYIPSLDEHFSLMAVDYKNEEHVKLFHKWQNDPRVAQGWKETGTVEEHRAYLKRQHDDPHQLTVFGRFNDTPFSYFELYWAKEDTVGAHYDAGDYDRGRHSLVGDARFRGRHRVLGWWSCIIHYLFLDDHRTNWVIGEPVATNNQVLIYDYTHGLHLDKYIDFPHKRAALVRVSRERFFQLCPFYQTGGFVAGTGLPLPARL